MCADEKCNAMLRTHMFRAAAVSELAVYYDGPTGAGHTRNAKHQHRLQLYDSRHHVRRLSLNRLLGVAVRRFHAPPPFSPHGCDFIALTTCHDRSLVVICVCVILGDLIVVAILCVCRFLYKEKR